MKKALSISTLCLICLTLISSCTNYNRAIHTQKKAELDKPVERILVLFVETDNEILQLDEQYYDKSIRGNFNNLEHKRFRDHLTSVSSTTFDPILTFDGKDFFEDHQDYTYEEFQSIMGKGDFEHLLIISMRNNLDRGKDAQQNFQVYLFDKDKLEPLWTGFGYFNQGNIIRKGVARKLTNRIYRDLNTDGMLVKSTSLDHSEYIINVVLNQ